MDVSVIIPNYNRIDLLRRCLTSVKNQTYLPREVIVIDDHSLPSKLEDIKEVIRCFTKALNLKLILSDVNRGANACRNRGIFSASSRWIAFIDSDDLWMPEKLQIQMSRIASHPSIERHPVLSATGRYRVDGAGTIIAKQQGARFLDPGDIRRRNNIGTLSSVVVEAQVARQIGGFDEELSASQDWDFFIRLADHVHFIGVPEPLCIYVDHEGERISGGSVNRLKSFKQILDRYHSSAALREEKSSYHIDRLIAEELQALGQTAAASQFYANYLAQRHSRSVSASSKMINLWLSIFGLPNLKEARYRGYRRTLRKLRTQPREAEKLTFDQNVILGMMN